ncbi:hypothetical protein KCV01_g16546, partial [Aureobasidium melanogenum]
LIDLSQSDIDRIVAKVPGGISNVQDIYGLSPLQDGILFHHLLAEEGDPYLLVTQLVFTDRDGLDRFVDAVQRVVARHDILRTAFVWDQVSEPAQVVWRTAKVPVSAWTFDPEAGPIAEQLRVKVDPRHHRIDLGQAPLLRYDVAQDPGDGRWHVVQRLHHLVGDHSGLEILYDEVQAILSGQGDTLAPAQPFRHLVAQARLGIGEAAHEAYFREQLADVETPSLPFGLGEVHRDGQQVHEAHTGLPAALNERLRAQARQHGVSLASLCHLAWGQVVARSSGQETAVFGTVLFGRMHGGEGADRAMGLFINTLPLRLDLGDSSVVDSVRTTHRKLAELLQHEHASLAVAQRSSGVQAPSPLFSAMLNYRHNRSAAAGTEVERSLGIEVLAGEERTNYPLALSVEDHGDALGLTAQVVEPLRPEAICGYMRQALESLADALEHTPAAPVRELSILPDAERKRLLGTWNDTARSYPTDKGIHQLFESQVARTPDAIALVVGDEQVSYADLNAQANRLAHTLIARGVGPDVRVAVYAERGIGMVVGLLAILKAGGGYVPLDPAYPRDRLEWMLGDSAPQVLLTTTALRDNLPVAGTVTVIELDDPSMPWADASPHDPVVAAFVPTNLAYVIYTSGSTGRPKGVMNEHLGVVNRLVWMQEAYRLGSDDAVLQKTPFGFDVSVWEFFWPLLNGARLVMARPEGHKDPSYLAQAVRRHGITTMHFVPSMLQLFVDSGVAVDLPSLRQVMCSGEALPGALARRFLQALPSTALHNLYGPTEAAVDVTAWHCAGSDLPDNLPIGRPIANTAIYLLDAHGEPVPQGATGELYIGGVQVARGYLNRPDLTAERFLRDPFSEVPGARMYRTGDVARHLPDGNVVYLGRNDDQVKIRGFRIELGEIEGRLLEQAIVRDAAVVARDGAGGKRLVGYLVWQGGVDGGDPIPALRAQLAERLPDYMVPSAFVVLDALPLTPNGKLDRKALPAPDDEAYARERYEAPEGAVETTLATLWQDLLGVEKVGRHDNFFALGGHSLLA